jgi:PAS domain S-box-containing protein
MKAECEMVERKELGFEAFDNLSYAVMTIDSDFNILTANKAACKLVGCKDAIGRKCYALTHNSAKPCWENGELCPVRESFLNKKSSLVVHKHIHDGIEVFEEITSTPVFNKEGELAFVIEELRDISKLLKLETVINHLRSEIKTLEGIIPICSSCKKVRDDEGFWSQVENYISTRSGAKFSHSLCPDCLKELYPDFAKKLQDRKDNENSGT